MPLLLSLSSIVIKVGKVVHASFMHAFRNIVIGFIRDIQCQHDEIQNNNNQLHGQ